MRYVFLFLLTSVIAVDGMNGDANYANGLVVFLKERIQTTQFPSTKAKIEFLRYIGTKYLDTVRLWSQKPIHCDLILEDSIAQVVRETESGINKVFFKSIVHDPALHYVVENQKKLLENGELTASAALDHAHYYSNAYGRETHFKKKKEYEEYFIQYAEQAFSLGSPEAMYVIGCFHEFKKNDASSAYASYGHYLQEVSNTPTNSQLEHLWSFFFTVYIARIKVETGRELYDIVCSLQRIFNFSSDQSFKTKLIDSIPYNHECYLRNWLGFLLSREDLDGFDIAKTNMGFSIVGTVKIWAQLLAEMPGFEDLVLRCEKWVSVKEKQ